MADYNSPSWLREIVEQHFKETPKREVLRGLMDTVLRMYHGEQSETGILPENAKELFRAECRDYFGIDLLEYKQDPEGFLNRRYPLD